MSAQSLAEYVAGLLSQGYSERQIRQSLAQASYPQSMVDAAFSALRQGGEPGQRPAAPQQPAADPLASYVRTYLSQGYRPEQLRPYLLQQGYPAAQVEGALAAATGQAQTVKHEVHLPVATVLKVAFLLLILGGVIYGLTLLGGKDSGSTPSRLLDVTLNADPQEALPGEEVIVESSVTSMGTKERYDVTLTYTLADEDGVVVWSEERTKAVSTSITDTVRIPIEDGLDPGDYQVNLRASYGGESDATAFERIEILRPETPRDDEEPRNDDEEPRGDGTPPIIIIETDDEDDSIEAALEAARRGATAEAEAMCEEIRNQARHDSCLSSLVLSDQEPSHCDAIISLEERETCYMPFIINGDYALCAKLETKERKDLCENLEHLSGLQSTSKPRTPSIDEFAQQG